MKASKFLLIGCFVSVFITLSFFSSCTDSEFEPVSEVMVIASEIVESDELNSYWVKREGSSTWEMMTAQIANFDYEKGYEYVIQVSVKKIKNPGPDQLSHSYNLMRVISKEKKDSEVPKFTKDPSAFDYRSKGVLAFPNATREVVTLSNGMQIEKVDSFYIYQGDIVLNEEQVQKLFIGNSAPNSLKSGITTSSIKYWANNKVYYTFAPGFSLKQNVYDAIDEWETKTSLSFVESTGYGDYIEIFHGDGNYSNSLGRKEGKQVISLDETGSNTGTAIHEIGHAVGLIHEQCRNDRDNWVVIFPDNIQPAAISQFDTYPSGAIRDIGIFDFNSVMLYSSFHFSKNGQPTMETTTGYIFDAQRFYLSSRDVEGIRSAYGPPFHTEKSTVNVIAEYVSGMEDYYEYEREYTIRVYTNKNYNQPTSLQYPRNVT